MCYVTNYMLFYGELSFYNTFMHLYFCVASKVFRQFIVILKT